MSRPSLRLPRLSILRLSTPRRHSSTNSPLITTNFKISSSTGHVRILELNRPQARNALSVELVTALREQIAHVRAQYAEDGREVVFSDTQLGPTRALVIASAVDACFCAGADLKERQSFTPQQTSSFLTLLRTTLDDLSNLPVPTISAISSLALGGGLELALATHFRILTTNAKVGLPETRLAIIPGAGGTHRLPDLIGRARARDMILTGRRVTGSEAYRIGLADRLVEVQPRKAHASDETSSPDAGLLRDARVAAHDEALRLANEICEGGPIAVRAAIEAVDDASPLMEVDMYDRVVDTCDRNEALKAFVEKRKPVFTGR
ncbi:enoyl-CoA hydratase/isomerase [Ophiocordyceps camponoti-floridani]|uniref:Enoyl-CoA hydratase/isomerase n=1 Tax=Ophiocordyceps camponoti-floridani TaxID=2030778 RepID=A0A8H4Q5T4_9HYPO|nr:enoyl-CoA hydratase/isomerase [Ophiocordyceps camponoti-floridani]